MSYSCYSYLVFQELVGAIVVREQWKCCTSIGFYHDHQVRHLWTMTFLFLCACACTEHGPLVLNVFSGVTSLKAKSAELSWRQSWGVWEGAFHNNSTYTCPHAWGRVHVSSSLSGLELRHWKLGGVTVDTKMLWIRGIQVAFDSRACWNVCRSRQRGLLSQLYIPRSPLVSVIASVSGLSSPSQAEGEGVAWKGCTSLLTGLLRW